MMSQPTLFEEPARRIPTGYLRQPYMDAQFQRVFGVPLDDYYYGLLGGLHIIRFNDELLQAGDLSMEEALLRRVVQAQRDGVRFSVHDTAFVYYVRYLCTGNKSDVQEKTDEYDRRLKALREAQP